MTIKIKDSIRNQDYIDKLIKMRIEEDLYVMAKNIQAEAMKKKPRFEPWFVRLLRSIKKPTKVDKNGRIL